MYMYIMRYPSPSVSHDAKIRPRIGYSATIGHLHGYTFVDNHVMIFCRYNNLSDVIKSVTSLNHSIKVSR